MEGEREEGTPSSPPVPPPSVRLTFSFLVVGFCSLLFLLLLLLLLLLPLPTFLREEKKKYLRIREGAGCEVRG